MLILTRSEVQLAISMTDAVASVKRAFAALSTGRADVPLRSSITEPKYEGTTLVMPGYLPNEDALAVKIASVHHQNRDKQMPVVHAVVVLIDPSTGQPLAVMDGSYLTALRTGAASGAATELLARPDAKTAAVFGAGAQGRMQVLGICAVRPIERIWIYDPNPRKVELLKREMRDLGPEIIRAETPSQAVIASDIICTATTSMTPVFDGNDLRPGTHINAIGSYRAEMQEIDVTTITRASKIVVDSRAAALSEAGDLIIPLRNSEIRIESIYAELGEIAASVFSGREHDEEITLFKSVGNAAQDVCVAREVYDRARAAGLGTSIEL